MKASDKTITKAIGLSIPEKLHRRFRALAGSEGKSMGAKARELVQRAVEEFDRKQAQARRIGRGTRADR